MRSVYERQVAEQTEIDGQIMSGADKIVPPPNWVWWARRCFPPPKKVDVELAAIAGKDPRTARRWLSGEFEPPNCVVVFLFAKMFERGF